MILLQISSAQGPAECCLAVSKALHRLTLEATKAEVQLDVLEQEAGPKGGTLRSVLVGLDGEREETLAQAWQGTLQWISPSPFRPNHPRKNWFIGVFRCEEPGTNLPAEIRFETMRASGAGGQHVNKTESAVRATHLATGISVRVQTERSQHTNKRLALALIAHRLAGLAEAADAALKASRRMQHYQVERGSPTRVFTGAQFSPVGEPAPK